jgi:hypothetical protein
MALTTHCHLVLVLGQSRTMLLLCLCDFMACYRENFAVHVVAVFYSHVILLIMSILLELLKINCRPAVNLVYLDYVPVSNVKICKWNPKIVKKSLKLTLFYEFYVSSLYCISLQDSREEHVLTVESFFRFIIPVVFM